MNDDRDFIEKAQWFARHNTGNEMTPETFVNEFSKLPVGQRVNYLEEVERDLSRNMTIREAGRIRRFLGPLQRRHRELLAVQR